MRARRRMRENFSLPEAFSRKRCYQHRSLVFPSYMRDTERQADRSCTGGGWLIGRKNEREKKKRNGSGKREEVATYDDEKGQGAGLQRLTTLIYVCIYRQVHQCNILVHTTHVDTRIRCVYYARMYVHNVHEEALHIRVWTGSRSRLMLHNIGRHHWNKPSGINLNVF